jgi:hypothetical protein
MKHLEVYNSSNEWNETLPLSVFSKRSSSSHLMNKKKEALSQTRKTSKPKILVDHSSTQLFKDLHQAFKPKLLKIDENVMDSNEAFDDNIQTTMNDKQIPMSQHYKVRPIVL